MSDLHWSERLFDRVTKSPGLWAFLCLGLAVICAAILGVDRLDPTFLNTTPTFRPYALVGVIVGLVGAVWLSTIHWRSRSRPVPEVAASDLIAKVIDKIGQPSTLATYSGQDDAFKKPQEARTPFEAARKVIGAKGQRIARDAQTGEVQSGVKRIGEERDKDGRLIGVILERDKSLNPIWFASLRVTSPPHRQIYLNQNYRESAGLSGGLGARIRCSSGIMIVETLDEQRRVDFRKHVPIPHGTNNIEVVLDPVVPPQPTTASDKIAEAATPPDASIWAKDLGETRVVMPEETMFARKPEGPTGRNLDSMSSLVEGTSRVVGPAGPPPVEPIRPVQKSLQTRIDHLSTRGRDYLRLIKAQGLTLVEGHYQETTLVELLKAGFLLQLRQSPEGRAQFILSEDGYKTVELIKPDIIPPSFTGRPPWDP